MTLRRWIVRRSNYPFTVPGQQLGVVEAPDKTAAAIVAAAQFAGALTIEPEHQVNPELERVVNRAVQAANRRERGAYGRGFSRSNPMNTADGDSA
jgi:hypothetical protein